MIEQARIALINHVLGHLNLDGRGQTSFDLSPYLDILPRGYGQTWNIFDTLQARKPYQSKLEWAQSLNRFERLTFGQAGEVLKTPFKLPDPVHYFDTWAAIIEAQTHQILSQQGEEGIALCHEFKLLSALVHATHANSAVLENGFTLISGDFPGIQRVIYTITSDGATKGVRGRSFFLQLLTECIVRNILGAYSMPITNALYIAGSRFLLLLPPSVDLTHIANRVNTQLLALFEGDLSFTLATIHLSLEAIYDDAVLSNTLKQLKEEEGRQKLRPFAHIDPASLFREYGIGNKYFCAISRREPRNEAEITKAQMAERRQEPWICDEQLAFQKLAEKLATVQSSQSSYLIFSNTVPQGYENVSYPMLLHQISEWSCVIASSDAERSAILLNQPDAIVISLNHTNYTAKEIQGHRYLALHTPRVGKADEAWWSKKYEANADIREGMIRNFELLATRGTDTSFVRYGVLRMDVDSLGDYFSGQNFDTPTLTRRIALSYAVSTFFEVYLPQICQDVELNEKTPRPSSLYLIYSGGDDLFIVGEWDILPELAQRIHDYLDEFSNGRLTISAGIEIVPAKFPFYVVATLAKNALDNNAKEYNPHNTPEPRKDAICLLGETLGWQDGTDTWHTLKALKETLKTLYKSSGQMTVVRNVNLIHERWMADLVRYGDGYIQYGPFHWLTAYRMSQIKRTMRNDSEKDAVAQLQSKLLQPNGVHLAGIAARWAEFEIRTGI